jgi:hypothetical protein
MVNTLFLTATYIAQLIQLPRIQREANLQMQMLQEIISNCLLANHHLDPSHIVVAAFMIDIMAYASFGTPIYADLAYDVIWLNHYSRSTIC